MAASADASRAALTVIAWGNESRGDDGIGPLVASRLRALECPDIVVVEDYQLYIEHMLDLQRGIPALFVDASVAIADHYRLSRLKATDDAPVSTHSISPTALLALYERTLNAPAPDAYLLEIRGCRFELGEDLSLDSRRAVDAAMGFLETLIAAPPGDWPRLLGLAASRDGKDRKGVVGHGPASG